MIVVAGEALVDLVIDQTGGVVAALGGGPFNTARTIARLGSQVTFLGSVSRDRFGTLLFERLLDDGVDPSMTQRTELPTSLAAAELDAHGSATYRFYLEHTAAPNLAPASLPAQTAAVHAGTLGFVVEPMASVLEALILAAPADVLVMLDLNCRPKIVTDRDGYVARLRRAIVRADIVKVSTEDLDYLDFAETPTQSCAAILAMGATVVLHTDGSQAVRLYINDDNVDIPVPVVQVADTIGAGDSFGGAFLAWWLQSGLGRADLSDIDCLAQAASIAVVVAGITCSRVGAEPPFASELANAWCPLSV